MQSEAADCQGLARARPESTPRTNTTTNHRRPDSASGWLSRNDDLQCGLITSLPFKIKTQTQPVPSIIMKQQIYRTLAACGLVIFAGFVAVPALAQSTTTQPTTVKTAKQEFAKSITVKSIFSGRDFRIKSFSPAWEATGKTYLFNKPAEAGGFDLMAVDPVTNKETLLIPASQLIPEGQTKPLSIAHHQWSADRELALIFTNTRKVWRRHTRGDYWLVNRKTGQLRQIGAQHSEATLMFAKLSPDAKRVAYVCDGDLYMEDLASGKTTRLTEKRTPEIINGTSDWVYEEEFHLRDCFRWCPDSKRIAYWEFDTSEVGEFVLVNNTDTLYPTLKKFKHTKPGQKNSAVRLGVITVDDKQTTWLKIEGDPRENYIARARWRNENELIIQHLNRVQNKNSVLIANGTTGETKQLFADTNESWVETCDWDEEINDGKEMIWVSEKDHWRHIYRVDMSTGQMKLITPDAFDAFKPLRVTDEYVYFLGSKEQATERYLYRCPITGGPAVQVTPDNFGGWNDYKISPDGSIAFHTYSRIDLPPTTTLIELPTHKAIRKIAENNHVTATLKELTPVSTEFIKVPGDDGTQLDSWLMKPANFDPTKKYPLIVFVYGEPAGTTVTNSWGGSRYLWHRMMAEQGYAVCSVDNRGTKVPRGADFRRSIYRQIGILAPKDQAAAIKHLTTSTPWLDQDRVGVWGWSGGGSMTLNAMFKYPDIYHTGVSIAAVPNMRYYDSIYQERYQGIPKDNPTGYNDGSPIHFAKNLKGNLLIVHGTGDDNCHYQTVELLLNELIKQDKQFSMMAYPNRSHSINEGANTSVHLYTMMKNFFMSNMPAGPR